MYQYVEITQVAEKNSKTQKQQLPQLRNTAVVDFSLVIWTHNFRLNRVKNTWTFPPITYGFNCTRAFWLEDDDHPGAQCASFKSIPWIVHLDFPNRPIPQAHTDFLASTWKLVIRLVRVAACWCHLLGCCVCPLTTVRAHPTREQRLHCGFRFISWTWKVCYPVLLSVCCRQHGPPVTFLYSCVFLCL